MDRLSYWLARASVPHRGGKQGKPQTCKDLFNRVNNHHQGEEGQRELQEIIPDIMIDGRFLHSNLHGAGAALFRGFITLVDVKTKSCCSKYPAAAPDSAAVVKKRQEQVNKDYHTRARKLDEERGTIAGTSGSFAHELNQYGQNGRVVGPVVGAFAEVSPDIYAISDLVASVLADEHCSYFSEKPSAAKAMFTQKLYRSLGLTAHLGWARLLVDRYRDLVQIPAAARQQTSRRHNTPHHFTPDDEDAYEHDAYLNPDYPHHPL